MNPITSGRQLPTNNNPRAVTVQHMNFGQATTISQLESEIENFMGVEVVKHVTEENLSD